MTSPTSGVTSLDSRRPDTKTVYLVAHIDTESRRIVSAGIYSEPARSLSGAIGRGCFAFDVHEETGRDFEDASRKLLDMPEPYRSVFAWALDMVQR